MILFYSGADSKYGKVVDKLLLELPVMMTFEKYHGKGVSRDSMLSRVMLKVRSREGNDGERTRTD